MVRVLDDIKLDFSNVLIRPKRSTLKSRAAVSLSRTMTFKHSKQTFTGVPIIAANMGHPTHLPPRPPPLLTRLPQPSLT